jgi:SAM-dependent methyltransferase
MLDVYCRMAWSALSILPRRKHWSYLGIDRNEERVGLARKSIAALSNRARIDVGEPAPLRLRDESVDAVLAIRALQTTEDTRPILEEAYRVLRPGGRLLVVEPDGLAEAFYFNGHLAQYNQAFHHLCATLDRQLDAAYADLPATARPGLALGPQLAIRAEAAGFSVKKVAVHAATNLQPVALEGLVRRLRGYPRAIARANGMDIEAPEVIACRTAAATLLKSLPRDSVARGGNTLPLFLCVAVKT